MINNCGKPHDGLVADIMLKTRLQYHAAIRAARKSETDIVNKAAIILLLLAYAIKTHSWSARQ